MPGQERYQSLYRRYRPQRFAEFRGQEHVTRALRNALRDDRVSHGYLFSGPRGTGKTTMARILAKGLNCAKLDDGDPCGICESCVAIQSGSSFDVIELDAATNRGIDAMRELVTSAALGSPGRSKVYILDEAHHLTGDASTALLKTLEEPPGHVVFVLATTHPEKILPTIRSRVQHYEFHLFSPEVLGEIVRTVSTDAGLGLEDKDLDAVVRRGAGSARDALSALDQAAALGGAGDEVAVIGELVQALREQDVGKALVAVAHGLTTGRDPRRIAEELLDFLRNALLASIAPSLVTLPRAEAEAASGVGEELGKASIVWTMETLGNALADMREALDPRVSLEVALVRAIRPAEVSIGALAERVERLERSIGDPVGEPVTTPPTDKRHTLGSVRRSAPASAQQPTAAIDEPVEQPVPTESGAPLTRDELTKAWGDRVVGTLRPRARALFALGRFASVEDGVGVFALPNAAHRDKCEKSRTEVEAALATHFGRPVRLRLVADGAGPEAVAPMVTTDDADLLRDELVDAPPPASPADRLKSAFPGAEEVE